MKILQVLAPYPHIFLNLFGLVDSCVYMAFLYPLRSRATLIDIIFSQFYLCYLIITYPLVRRFLFQPCAQGVNTFSRKKKILFLIVYILPFLHSSFVGGLLMVRGYFPGLLLPVLETILLVWAWHRLSHFQLEDRSSPPPP